MSDQTGTTQTPSEQEAAQAAAEAAAAAASSNSQNDPWANLPEEFSWVKEKVADSNAEAAKYRTQRNEAQQKLSEAKTVEEFEAARADFEKQNAALELELARARVARTHGLTDDDLEILEDITDPEALEAKAGKLAARVKKDPAPPAPPRGDLRAGRGNQAPGDAPKEEDGHSAWQNFKRKRR